MFPRSQILISGGTFNYQNRTSRAMDILMEWVATGAFHNSRELYDAPKCHPHTRVAVLEDIMEWVTDESESAQEDFMMWLFGPAGAGKSAIAKRIAEMAAEKDLLIADFFFSRTSPNRNTMDHLIPTLAYQLALSIYGTRSYIEDTIERDPAIFSKNIQTQIDALLIRPLRHVLPPQIFPSQKLIIIDGLDECKGSKAQVAILEAIAHSFIQQNVPIKFLLVSRPEPDIVTSFDCNEPLKSIHRRLALDDKYRPDDDICRFFSDTFEHIKRTHPLRSTIPTSWPTEETLRALIRKSSGHFIYASTVVKFVQSNCHQPPARLHIILGISPPGKMNPFAELDALYNHLLSSVDDIQITLRVLSFYVITPYFASMFRSTIQISPEFFLSLEPGSVHLSLIHLSSIVTYHQSSGNVEILHASLADFLSDQRRSTTFYIDKASTCTQFIRRILQCVKGPDGIRAGDHLLFQPVKHLCPWAIFDDQLKSDILSFDLDAFINASIGCYYKENSLSIEGSTVYAFEIWKYVLTKPGLKYKGALDRLNKSFESRLQIYQSDWRLQLLLPLTAVNVGNSYTIPSCRCMDILLGTVDDHHLHLVDQHALNLRHTYSWPSHRSIDGNAYASAALHCMRFLSNPPKYSERNEHPEMGLTYSEWQATCRMTLDILFEVLHWANTLPELVQFICKHDIHPAVQSQISTGKANDGILEFLNRAHVCTARIRLSSRTSHSTDQLSDYSTSDEEGNTPGEWTGTPHYMRRRQDLSCSNVRPEGRISSYMRQRLDLCCSNVHQHNS